MWRIDPEWQGQPAKVKQEEWLRCVAGQQHGVISRRQLKAIGFAPGTIDDRVARKALIVVHRGVYAVGHAALRDEGRWLAAVLACGETARLSHRLCASLWELRPVEPDRRIDVLVVPSGKGTGARDTALLKVHRTRALPPDDIAERLGVPCTSVARTLIDLADVLPRRDVERCAGEASVRGVLDVDALLLAAARSAGRKGGSTIRELVHLHGGVPPTRSDLEDAFLALCIREGWPRPVVNGGVGGFEVDFHWPEFRLAVEVHGGRCHRHEVAFERDHRKMAMLTAAGWRVLAFTWRQVMRGDPLVVAATGAALGGLAA